MNGDEQLSIFDTPGPRPMVRTSDPTTSQAAAASMTPEVLGAQLRSVLWAVDQHDRHSSHGGATAHDVVMVLAYGSVPAPQQSVVARRLTDLRDKGLICDSGRTRPGSTSRHLIIWALTDEGRKALSS